MSVHIKYEVDKNIYKNAYSHGYNAIIQLIKSNICPSKKHMLKILDVGCGRGELMHLLSSEGYDCSGIDFDEKCVKLSSRYGVVKRSDADSLDSAFKKEAFDIVIFSHILEHVSNQTEIIQKAKFVSKKYILIAVPNACSTTHFFQGLTKRIPAYVNKGHVVGWAPGHLRTFLECTCNLKIIAWGVEKVSIPSRASVILTPFGLKDYLELKLLPKIFPLLSDSLIVLCEKKEPI